MPFAHFDGLKSLFRGTESRRGDRSIARRAALSRRPDAEQMEDRKLLTYMMINDPVVVEGTGGTKDLAFTVSLAVPTSKTVTVDYQTADASAKAGLDYLATRGTLTFAPGQTTRTISVPIVGDALPELTEAFYMRLSGAMNAFCIDSAGIGTITDDDTAKTPELSIGDPRIAEGNSGTSLLTFDVSLNTAVNDKVVTVKAQTRNGTALEGEDYEAKSEWLTFFPGETKKSFSVTVYGDTKVESSEAVYVVLSDGSEAIKKGNGVGFILNDDLS